MERGYKNAGRHPRTRRRTVPRGGDESYNKSAHNSAIKLAVCAVIFVIAVLIKFAFPAFFNTVSERLTAAIDYKSALTVLGEGLSGERKFTTAVGEAFTYAFRGTPPQTQQDDTDPEQAVSIDGETEDSAEAFFESAITENPEHSDATASADSDNPGGSTEQAGIIEEESLTNAIISAFMQTQDSYSDYNLPAGVTYEMPALGISYTAPVSGKVTSEFGYREHPTDGAVKFHYGVDIGTEENTPIAAFADGEVIAVGESTTMGKYLLINHDGAETKYAHCSEIFVESGQAVKMGEEIAIAGSTGNATSTCLHFELLIGGYWVNPEFYLIKI